MVDDERDIRTFLRTEAERAPHPTGITPASVLRARRTRAAFLASSLLAATILIGGIGVGVSSILDDAEPPVAPPVDTTPHPTPVEKGRLIELTATESSVWAVTCDRKCSNDGRDSDGNAVRLDPQTGNVEASVSIHAPHNIAIGEGAIWVISFWDGIVYRIDPITGSVAATVKLELPREAAPGDSQFLPFDVTAGEGAVWVSTARGAIARVDPDTNRVAAITSTPGDTTGHLAAGEGAVWVAQNILGLYRVDPGTNRVVAEIPIQEGNKRLAIEGAVVGGGAVWVTGTWAQGSAPDAGGHVEYVTTEEEAVYRIDPRTNTATPLSVTVDHGPIVFGEGALWITSRAGAELSRVDPSSREVSDTFGLERGERLLGVGGGAVWVADANGAFRRIHLPGP